MFGRATASKSTHLFMPFNTILTLHLTESSLWQSCWKNKKTTLWNMKFPNFSLTIQPTIFLQMWSLNFEEVALSNHFTKWWFLNKYMQSYDQEQSSLTFCSIFWFSWQTYNFLIFSWSYKFKIRFRWIFSWPWEPCSFTWPLQQSGQSHHWSPSKECSTV